MGAAGAYVAGPLGKGLIDRGWNRLRVRKLMIIISHICPAFCLILLAQVQEPSTAVVLLVITMGLHALNAGGFHAHLQDVAASKAGTILGMTNTAGNLCSSIAALLIASVLQSSGNFKIVFYACACLYCAGAFVFCCFVHDEQLTF